jgi:hypothetical protein
METFSSPFFKMMDCIDLMRDLFFIYINKLAEYYQRIMY